MPREATMAEVTIQVYIDLVSRERDGSCVLTLIEEGPWETDAIQANLGLLAKRICDCVTAVVNGQIAMRYPACAGQSIAIQVNSFETPREQVQILLDQLSQQFSQSQDIQAQLGDGHFAQSITLRQEWIDWATVIAAQSPHKTGQSFWSAV